MLTFETYEPENNFPVIQMTNFKSSSTEGIIIGTYMQNQEAFETYIYISINQSISLFLKNIHYISITFAACTSNQYNVKQ